MQLGLYNEILNQMETYYNLCYTKPKAGRKPILSLPNLAAILIMSYITNSPMLTMAKILVHPSIKSYHIFRRYRLKQLYLFLRGFLKWRLSLLIVIKIASGKRYKLIVDGTILPVANTNRARTQRIKRFAGRPFWTKRNRNIYSQHYGKKVRWQELYYGILVMVVCDENGIVWDVWFKPGSMHESKAYKERLRRNRWLREITRMHEVYGDKGYRGVEGVTVCSSKEMRSIRQTVEGVISSIKSFNSISRWRKGITLLSYLYAYAIGYSFFRKSNVWY